MPGRRILRVTDWFLREMLGTGEHCAYKVAMGLPADAKIVNCVFNSQFELFFLFESKEWEEGPEGAGYCELVPHVTVCYDAPFIPFQD